MSIADEVVDQLREAWCGGNLLNRTITVRIIRAALAPVEAHSRELAAALKSVLWHLNALDEHGLTDFVMYHEARSRAEAALAAYDKGEK